MSGINKLQEGAKISKIHSVKILNICLLLQNEQRSFSFFLKLINEVKETTLEERYSWDLKPFEIKSKNFKLELLCMPKWLLLILEAFDKIEIEKLNLKLSNQTHTLSSFQHSILEKSQSLLLRYFQKKK